MNPKSMSEWAALSARLLILFSPLGIDWYLPALPSLVTAFGVQANLSMAAYLIPLGVGQLLFGPLGDRYGKRRVSLLGVLIFILASLLLFTVQTLEGLIAYRVMQGIGASACSVCAMALIRDYFEGDQAAREYSFLGGMLNVVPFLAPVMGALVLLYLDWRASFMALALMASVVLLALWRWMPRDRARLHDAPLGLFDPLKNTAFVFYSFCSAWALAIILTYVTLAPGLFIHTFGWSALAFSLFFAANAGIISLGFFMVSKLLKRYTAPVILRASMLLMLVGGVLMLLLEPMGGVVSFVIPMVAISFLFGGVMAPANSLAMNEFAAGTGRASAILGCLQMSLSALVSGFLSQQAISAPMAIGLVCVCAMLGLLGVYGFLQRRNKLSGVGV